MVKVQGPRMKLTQDIDSGMVWMSEPVDYGDYPIRYQVTLEYADGYDQEWADRCGKYIVEARVTSTVASVDKLGDAANSCGMSLEEFKALPDESQHEILREYGLAPRLFSTQGNNKTKALRAARKELVAIGMLFGFYMDRPQNAIGATGWDWIKGDLWPTNRDND